MSKSGCHEAEHEALIAAIEASSTYRLAEGDISFLESDPARPLRLGLELLRPEQYLHEHRVVSTVVVFGSTRIPEPAQAAADLGDAEARLAAAPGDPRARRELDIARRRVELSRYYEEARRLGHLLGSGGLKHQDHELVVMTGGGPGIMEAANRGACEAGAENVGLNIVLPREQRPNPYITPALAFRFHYFAMRKMHFMMRARALVAFPGGYGTFDEVFEALTLVQTGKIERMPIILVGREFWQRAVGFGFLADAGVIDAGDLDLVTFVETGEEAVAAIRAFYDGPGPAV